MTLSPMAVDNQPIYRVDPFSDPVIIKICGRASFQNAGPLSTFFQEMLQQGVPRFILDFGECTGMDSTFLGIIAGAALETRKVEGEGGYLALLCLGERNLELVRNLGLHRLARVDSGELSESMDQSDTMQPLSGDAAVTRKVLITAHENLAGINEANLEKFQDIVEYLKSRLKEGDDK